MKIKDTPKLKKEITRKCVICGGDILVKVFVGGKYIGGNYFHSISECDSSSSCRCEEQGEG